MPVRRWPAAWEVPYGVRPALFAFVNVGIATLPTGMDMRIRLAMRPPDWMTRDEQLLYFLRVRELYSGPVS